jgi:hypothetical protein
MQEQELRNNYIFTLVKFILFLIILCFLVKLSTAFWRELKAKQGFDLTVLTLSSLTLFGCYAFLADLNNTYKKIQRFFFRTEFVSYLFPSVLIVMALCYFFLPKIFDTTFNKDIFVFIGGFSFTGHLVYTARQIKGQTFSAIINYFFIFSILYIFNLFLLGIYFKIGFPVYLGKVLIEGAQNGAMLIQNIFTQFSR